MSVLLNSVYHLYLAPSIKMIIFFQSETLQPASGALEKLPVRLRAHEQVARQNGREGAVSGSETPGSGPHRCTLREPAGSQMGRCQGKPVY